MDGDEAYEFTWVGKKAAIVEANKPIRKTLRPCVAESKDWDNTENLYIEGDNLEVLKILQESYLGKVKMIYIDPPYNTGNDGFVYPDDFSVSPDEYDDMVGLRDEENNILFRKNPDSNPRFHSDWCSMLYSRFLITRNLLSPDGVIFISIDDNEQENLKKICDEVFGEENFIAQLVWEKKKKGAFLSKSYINMKEYILVFCKKDSSFNGLIGEITTEEGTYPCIKTTNARGVRTIRKGTPSKYKESNYTIASGTRVSSGNMELIYLDDLVVRDGTLEKDVKIDSNWIYSQEKLDEYSEQGLVYITQDNYIRRIVNDRRVKMLKDLLSRVGSDGESLPIFEYDENLNNGGWGTNEDANDELHHLLGEQYIFDFSKPTRLLAKLFQSIEGKNCTILDFFSGSAASADAVMQLNAADGGKRKYIMVQIAEQTQEGSPAQKAGYKNICEIGKERIRRAGKKIKEESPLTTQDLDTGFRVLKRDSTNMQDIYYSPKDISQADLFSQVDNVKPDRTGEDLLFQVMLELGATLDSKIETTTVAGKTIYNVAEGYLVACFDPDVTDDVVKSIAQMQPAYAVLRDTSMKDDSTATNFEQIFKTYSPDTVTKIL